ncbi:L-amino acid N-acyltransferase YncA [Ferrimonas sediminum]|uniref:L-amino acid N-acyltransferase YncA n=1 Tax=Ferrimonas sediminum TaxID=718193 RepID=A0A1G8X588_9GAMM|nr:GNAT family N-acetyltransferase [Ferrimonas sediminum]SDJ85641.1 L-amino acid N-acyltransferase YncA [Ferrimonas sediminum]
MKGRIEVKRVELSDAESVLALYRSIIEENLPYIMNTPVPSTEQQIEFISGFITRRDPFFVAKLNGEVIGMASGKKADMGRMEFSFSIHRAHRRKGLGAKLHQRIEQEAKELGCFELFAMVDLGNPSRPFYAKRGYVADMEIHSFISFTGISLKAVTYRKALSP